MIATNLFTGGLKAAGILPERTPVLSFSIAEDELRKLPLRDMVGDYAAWDYFQSIDRPENREFVRRFKELYGAHRVTSDVIEAAYYSVRLWAQAVVEAESEDVADVLKAIRHQSLNAPEGIVSVDDETQHTWRPVYVGRIRADGQFDLVWSSEKPVRPIPYPSSRAHAEWEEFLNGLYRAWGGWANPGLPRILDVAVEIHRSARLSSVKTSQHRLHRHSDASRQIDCDAIFSRLVQVRPAMNFRLGSSLLSRISITTQLLIWFLCLSLVPCIVLTGIISYLSNQYLEKNRPSGTSRNL